MNGQTSALVIARSAQLRESLLVLLRALPRIQEIYQADGGDSALMMSQQIHPALVLLDHGLTRNEAQATLEGIKVAWPQARSIVLLDDEQDRRGVEAAGADLVLVKGMLAAKVLDMIDGALGAKVGSKSPHRGRAGSATPGRSRNGDLQVLSTPNEF